MVIQGLLLRKINLNNRSQLIKNNNKNNIIKNKIIITNTHAENTTKNPNGG